MKSLLFYKFKVSFGAILLFSLIALQAAYGQTGVAIAATTSTADPSAMLDIQSTTKGALVPRMTNSQRSSISTPANGLLVFCTDAPSGFYYNSGTSSSPNWVILSAGALTGTGTANYHAKWTGSNTLGSSVVYDDGTHTGIGTATPTQILDIKGLNTAPATSGTSSTAIFRMENTTTNGNVLDMGNYSTSPYGTWMQCTDRTTLAATYPLAINPGGGSVGIGTSSPRATLEVVGTAVNHNPGCVIDAQGWTNAVTLAGSTLWLSATTYTSSGVYGDTRLINQSGAFNTSTGVFTAAVSGFYMVTIRYTNFGTENTRFLFCASLNSAYATEIYDVQDYEPSCGGCENYGFTTLIYLNAGDTHQLLKYNTGTTVGDVLICYMLVG